MKTISIEKHRELARMKAGPPNQKHWAKLKECKCKGYRKALKLGVKQLKALAKIDGVLHLEGWIANMEKLLKN